MDGSRFDTLAKQLAGPSPRRSFLKGIGNAALVAVGIGGPAGSVLWSRTGDAAACRDGGISCVSDSQCCSGTCGEADSRGRRRCTCAEPQFACGLRCCEAGDVCLDGACQAPAPTATNTPTLACGEGGDCLVFVSTVITSGAIGGLAGADAACQYEAGIYDLPGTYKAWLSDSTASPSTRFTQSGPYKLVDGTVVADTWSDLVDGTVDTPIILTAGGNVITQNGSTFTGTDGDGTYSAASGSCLDWTSDAVSEFGRAGSPANTSSQWTSYTKFTCNSQLRLYCFQQATTEP